MGTTRTLTFCYIMALCESWIPSLLALWMCVPGSLAVRCVSSSMLDVTHICQNQRPMQLAAQACRGHA